MNGSWFCSERCAGHQASTDVDRVDLARQGADARAATAEARAAAGAPGGDHPGRSCATRWRHSRTAAACSGTSCGTAARWIARRSSRRWPRRPGFPVCRNLEPTAARWCAELGAHAVRALGLVPIGVDVERQHVKVACARAGPAPGAVGPARAHRVDGRAVPGAGRDDGRPDARVRGAGRCRGQRSGRRPHRGRGGDCRGRGGQRRGGRQSGSRAIRTCGSA